MADQDEHQPGQGSGPPHAQPPVGSVAEEAARLLDALGGWVSTSGYGVAPAPGAAPAPGTAPEPDVPDPDEAHPGAPDHGRGTDADDEQTDVPPGETKQHAAGHCDHCGAANGTGQAVTCQWCPVCQGIGLLRSVRPETVDRLADLAGALATALRDVATHTRGTSGAPDTPPVPHDSRTRGSRVQDITIEDEDQGSATP